jgi:hypothetical protein
MIKPEAQVSETMNRSLFALTAALGCFAAEPPAHPLLEVKRIYVDKLSGESSAQIRDMLINALQSVKLWQITENPERADAMLRGSAEDLIYTDTFQMSEGINARVGIGGGAGIGQSRQSGSLSAGVGDHESKRKTERKHEAMAAVRLVNSEGDVIWSTTQESNGAKFRGASADVAEKVIKQLLADVEKARRAPADAAQPN